MLVLVKRQSLQFLESVGDYVSLVFDVFAAVFRRPPAWMLIREQLYHIGVLSLSVVAISGFTAGFVLTAQSFYQLGEKGLAGVTGALVGKTMITELGPILTAFMVTGRIGSSMCAELGTMKVTEQIDALRSMAVNPYSYLIAPRFIAGTVMIPLLNLFCILTGIGGGLLMATTLFNMPVSSYLEPMQIHISLFDVATGVIKSIVYGILIVTVCCYRGMQTTGGAAGVGKATTESVVTSYVLILIADFFLTMALNMIRQEMKGL
jgi:phospholipid/cholesterol/gamma-HCH transport system permease protein